MKENAYGPSPTAARAARRAATEPGRGRLAAINVALDAAHDPALGLDRSVCLRDVVEWVRGAYDYDDREYPQDVAAAIAQRFMEKADAR